MPFGVSHVLRSSRRGFAHRAHRTAARGVTLIELMVVVMIIGILAVLALPNMGAAAVDRHVYEDASRISDMIHVARARAMGRGAAVSVVYDTSSGKGGMFRAREAVTPTPSGNGVIRVPSSSCMSPTDWSDATKYYEYAVLNLDGSYEGSNSISTQVYTGTPGALAASTAGAFCFTPMGRSYLVTGTVATKGMFDGQAPMLTPLLIEVAHRSSGVAVGIARTVVVPSNGVARINSSSALLK